MIRLWARQSSLVYLCLHHSVSVTRSQTRQISHLIVTHDWLVQIVYVCSSKLMTLLARSSDFKSVQITLGTHVKYSPLTFFIVMLL